MQAVEVNGASLAWREQGTGAPVLFIHGTGTYSELFDPVLDVLPPGMRAIVYDRRGFGGSAGPPARRLGDHVRDAAALLEALDAGPATIVGSSAGGVLALRLALDRPDLVSSLVLIEPAWQMALTASVSANMAMTRVHFRWLVRRDPEGAAISFYRWATRYADGRNQFDAYPEEWQRAGAQHATTALGELRQLLAPTPSARALRRLRLPVRIVIGDTGLPVFHRTSRRVLRRLSNAVEVPAVGAHLVYTDDPETCGRAIAMAVNVPGTDREGGSSASQPA